MGIMVKSLKIFNLRRPTLLQTSCAIQTLLQSQLCRNVHGVERIFAHECSCVSARWYECAILADDEIQGSLGEFSAESSTAELTGYILDARINIKRVERIFTVCMMS